MKCQINLCLDDVLDDAPQTRCLLGLFEEDSLKVGDFMSSVHSSLQRLVSAQNEITSSVAQLGSLLSSYKTQNFPLEKNGTDFSVVVDKFQHTITELSSWMEIVSQQLNNCALYPVNKFLREMNELNARKEIYYAVSDELDSATLKHAKLGRKDSTKKIDEINEELCQARRRFHLDGLHYYASLNKVQYSKRIALLEPILSVIYAFRSFCHVGHQSLTNDKELFGFFTRTQEQVQSLHGEQESEVARYNELVKTVNEIERLNPFIYNVEVTNEKIDNESKGNEIESKPEEKSTPSVESKNLHKEGYLYLKSKSGLMSKWDRLFFFTQSGNLMAQLKDELVGKVYMELTPLVKAAINDNEDRRHTFSAISYDGSKKQLILQASSAKERDEWIQTINFAANDAALSAAENFGKNGEKSKNGTGENQLDSPIDNVNQDSQVPIQFDLLTLSDEQDTGPTEMDKKIVEESFNCSVKFLGSIEVAADRDDRIVSTATKQILDVRLQYQITKSVDVKAVLAIATPPPRLLLVDQKFSDESPASLAVKASFRLDDVALWSLVANEDRRLALIVRTRLGRADGRHKFTCYLLEADCKESASKLCEKLTQSTRSAFQALASSNKEQSASLVETVVEKTENIMTSEYESLEEKIDGEKEKIEPDEETKKK